MPDPSGGDRAGRAYWDDVWKSYAPSIRREPDGSLRLTRLDRRFAELFARLGLLEEPAGKRLLEIGCAGSLWLPYFAELGFETTGLDYSEAGCASSRAILATASIDADVVLGDAFHPPAELVGAFDRVVSFGVVEHFEDTAGALRAFSRFLSDDGVLVTVIPNMTGLTGLAQRVANRPVYDNHVPLTVDDLRARHGDAGLICDCRYFMTVNLGVVALEGLDPARASTRVKQAILGALAYASKAVWLVEDGLHLPATRLLSPYVVCVARRGGDGESDRG